jgi:hypothetical protein
MRRGYSGNDRIQQLMETFGNISLDDLKVNRQFPDQLAIVVAMFREGGLSLV